MEQLPESHTTITFPLAVAVSLSVSHVCLIIIKDFFISFHLNAFTFRFKQRNFLMKVQYIPTHMYCTPAAQGTRLRSTFVRAYDEVIMLW